MLSVFLNVIAVFAAAYFILFYKRLKGYYIGFPLYFYIAFFPYKFYIAGREITDPLLKVLLIVEIILLLRDTGRKCKLYLYPILLVIAIAGCGMIASSYSPHFSSRTFLTGIANITFIFLLLFLLMNRINSKEAIEVIFECLYRNGIFLSIFAIIEKYAFHKIRVELSMSNTNYFAFYLAIILCLAFYYKKQFIIPIVLFGIYLSKSKAIILGLMLCCSIYILSRFITKKRLTYIVMVMIPIIFVTGLLLVGGGGYKKYDIITLLVGEKKDFSRIGIWADGLNDFRMRPLFGYGYNCWLSHSTPYIYVTHNDFLRIMVECGIVGVITFGLGWIYITRKIAKSTNAILYLSLVSVAAMFSCFHNNLNSYMCWLCIVMVIFDKYIPQKGYHQCRKDNTKQVIIS